MAGPAPQARGRKKKTWLIVLLIVLGAVALLAAAVIVFGLLFLRQTFPQNMMTSPKSFAQLQKEIIDDLDLPDGAVTVEIADGRLAERAALPQYRDGVLTYPVLDYTYDVVLTSGEGHAEGQVDVTCSMEAKPFQREPEAILFTGLRYSDALQEFIDAQPSLTSQDLLGRWELHCWEWGDNVISREALSDLEYTQDEIDAILAQFSLQFFENGTYLLSRLDGKVFSGTWYIEGNTAILAEEGGDQTIWTLEDEILSAETEGEKWEFTRASTQSWNGFGSLFDDPAEAPDDTPYTQTLLPDDLPLEFGFSSGVGAWGTYLTLYPDGYFEGAYHDSDMGDLGEEYPNGTTYLCPFFGQFENIVQVDAYTYSMDLAELYIEDLGAGAEEWIEDGVRYIASEPYGLEYGERFYLYTPQAPMAELPSEFLDWRGMWMAEEADWEGALGSYGLYNEEMGYGFFTDPVE